MILISTLTHFKYRYTLIILCLLAITTLWISISHSVAVAPETQLETDTAEQYQELHFMTEKGVLYTLQKSLDMVEWDDDLNFIGGGQLAKLRLFALNPNVAPENGNDAPYETVSAEVRSVSSGGTYVSWISLEDQTIKHVHLSAIELDPSFPDHYTGLKNGYYLFLNLNPPLTTIDNDSAVTGEDLNFKNALITILTGINNDSQNGTPALHPHRGHALASKQFWRIKSDPDVDSDGDGISNTEEISDGTNPLDGDTDNDGAPDGELLDTDLDGVPDIQDADPLDKAITWKKVAENPYFVIDLGLPAGVDLEDGWNYDLGEGGHVLISRYNDDLPLAPGDVPTKPSLETYVWLNNTWSHNLEHADHIRGLGTAIDKLGNVYGRGRCAYKVDNENISSKYVYFKWAKNPNAHTWEKSETELNSDAIANYDDFDESDFYNDYPLTIEPLFLDDRLLYGESGHFVVKTHHVVEENYSSITYSSHRLSPQIGAPFFHVPFRSFPTECRFLGEPNGWHVATFREDFGIGSLPEEIIFSKLTEAGNHIDANPPEAPARWTGTGLSSINTNYLPTGTDDIVIWKNEADGFQFGARSETSSDLTWQPSTKADQTKRIDGKINGRGEGLLPTKLWRNGNWTLLNDLVDSSLWPNLKGIDINGSGTILVQSGAKLVLLEPLQIIIPKVDTQGDLIADEFVVAKELKVSKMEQSLTVTKQNGAITKEELDIEKDIDRFYIRIKGGASISDNGQATIKIKTNGSQIATYHDDENVIKLIKKDGDLISKPLLLTSDHPDDDFTGDIDIVADDQEDDKTHLVQLGSKVVFSHLKIGNTEYDFNLELPVKKLKTVKVNFVIIDDDKVNIQEIKNTITRDLKVANERYAQAGFEIVKASEVVKKVPEGVEITNNSLKVSQGAFNIVLTDSVRTLVDKYGNVGDLSDIHVFYVPFKLSGGAFDSLDGFALNSYFSEEQDAGYLSNIFMTKSDWSLTLSHELGHILTNEGHVSVTDFNDPSYHNKVQTNLMTDAVTTNGKISESKRFFKSQVNKMKQSIHAKNP